MENKCICIYPKDIQRLLDKSYRASCSLLQTIKKYYGKKRYQLITVEEFCHYMGISEQMVTKSLGG
jgi:hypothetical protein